MPERRRFAVELPLRILATAAGLAGLLLYALARLGRGQASIVGYQNGTVVIKLLPTTGSGIAFPFLLPVLLTVTIAGLLVSLTKPFRLTLRYLVARNILGTGLAAIMLVLSLLPLGYPELRLYAEPNYWLSLTLVLGSLGFILFSWGSFPVLRRIGALPAGLWRPILRLPPRWFSVLVGGTALTVAAVAATAVLGGIPHITDEAAQLFQARIFTLGRLFAVSPPLPSFFDFKHVINDGRWYSQYPYGHPLMLALGVLAGLPWLVNPLQAAVAVLALYGLGREVYGERIARGAALLYCLSPFVWFMGGSFMNHTTSLCWGTLLLLFFSRLERRGIGNALLCGLSLGIVVATRPATALGIALPAVVWLLLRLRREPRLWARAAAGAGVVTVFGLLLLVQNWLTTGAPLNFGYTVLHGTGHGFVFGPAALGITHTPYKGLVHITSNLAGLNRYLFEWPVPALILPLSLLIIGPRRPWDCVLFAIPASLLFIHFFYFFHGYCYGPRFVFEAVPAILLLTAQSLTRLTAVLRQFTHRPTSRLRADLITLIAFAFVTGWIPSLPRLVGEYSSFSGVTARTINRARSARLSNALVFTRDYKAAFSQNRPDLSGPIVWARDLGPLNPLLAAAFAEREAWLDVEDGFVRIQSPRVWADSLLSELAAARTWALTHTQTMPGYRTLVWPLDSAPTDSILPVITIRQLNSLRHRRAIALDSILPALAIDVADDAYRGFEDLGPLTVIHTGQHQLQDGIRLTLLNAGATRRCWIYDVRRANDSGPIIPFRPGRPESGPALVEVARFARQVLPSGYRSIFWPSDHPLPEWPDSVRVLTYAQLYQSLAGENTELVDFLPALAFWATGSPENHPEVFGYMPERENYRHGGYYFTLLAASRDSAAIGYLVQSRVGAALNLVAGELAAMSGIRCRTVFWPSAHLTEPSRLLVAGLGRVVSYRAAWAAIDSGRADFADFLPAIAFWETNNPGRHPNFIRLMDSKKSFLLPDYRFTRLLSDPDEIITVWLIEPIH